MEKPLVLFTIHEYTEQGTNGDFLLVSKLRLKTTPTFALEKQTCLERKQMRFILTIDYIHQVIGSRSVPRLLLP